MIEMMIVLVIVSILLAIAIPLFSQGKSAARLDQVVSAGRAYDDAIRNFALDHGNRMPVTTSATDWVTAGVPVPLVGGPMRDDGRPYLAGGVPDILTQQGYGFVIAAPSPTFTGLDYEVLVPRTIGLEVHYFGYHIEVWDKGVLRCSFRNVVEATPEC